ncbi:MAG: hypothetical protein JWN70_3131 [Planctomycetaceae bacterium]|nr:hypothetical protein [Planctomycetaceae bacterium]
MDDKKNRGEPDRSRINMNEPYEAQYWSKKFGMTPEKLREVVQRVGTSPAEVGKVLGK